MDAVLAHGDRKWQAARQILRCPLDDLPALVDIQLVVFRNDAQDRDAVDARAHIRFGLTPHRLTIEPATRIRSEEHKSELQSLMRTSYAVFCLNKTQTHKHVI